MNFKITFTTVLRLAISLHNKVINLHSSLILLKTEVAIATLEYLKFAKNNNERPVLFNYVPHVFYLGAVLLLFCLIANNESKKLARLLVHLNLKS
jgi:hypothetical protein